jgi:hypothetical protein
LAAGVAEFAGAFGAVVADGIGETGVPELGVGDVTGLLDAGAVWGRLPAAVAGVTFNFFFGAPAVAKVSLGLLAMAERMKSIHMGRAARAPVSFSPRDWRLSKPIQVPQVTDGEKPTNQASV